MNPMLKLESTSAASAWILASCPSTPAVPWTPANQRYGVTSTCQPWSDGEELFVLSDLSCPLCAFDAGTNKPTLRKITTPNDKDHFWYGFIASNQWRSAADHRRSSLPRSVR